MLVRTHLSANAGVVRTHAHLDASRVAIDQVSHFVALPTVKLRLQIVDELDTQKMHARNVIAIEFYLDEIIQT